LTTFASLLFLAALAVLGTLTWPDNGYAGNGIFV